MDKIARIGISIDHELLKAFDQMIEEEGYGSRSEAVRDMIRKRLMEDKLPEGEGFVGTIVYVYDHHKREVTTKLISLQHDSHLDIRATMHVHMSHDHCLEVVVVSGSAEEIRGLGDNIKALKGVLYAQTVLASPLQP